MKKLKVAMVGGGGEQSFFGGVHRRSLALDGTRELVAGALRSNADASLAAATALGIKGFTDYQSLLDAIVSGEIEVDYVTIVTPNHVHYEPAKAFLQNGIPVLCEKPITMTVQEAEDLAAIVKAEEVPFVLAHTYTGHPMLMYARELVQSGAIGDVRKVEAWYTQGWLAEALEEEEVKQATWRVDPKRAGISCCGGDIGTHAFVAATWVTGLQVNRVSAKLNTFVKGRQLDDDFNVFAELENGGTAIITATQIAIGHKNDHGIRIFGSKGSVEWQQEQAERLLVNRGSFDEIYWLGANFDYMPSSIASYLRLPAGHHEDFLEALANLHASMERMIRRNRGEKNIPEAYPHPGVEAGVDGMKFVAAAVASAGSAGIWTAV